MKLHHILPPPHILAMILSSALAFAAGAYYAKRQGLALNAARAGSEVKARLKSLAQRFRRSSSAHDAAHMYATASGTRNSTGNAAFEEYRSATLTKLEQEAEEFRRYLDGLRHAKDKSEFDAFLEERRQKPTNETLTP